MFAQIGADAACHTWESAAQWGVLPAEAAVHKGESLFPRVDTEKALEKLNALQEAQRRAELCMEIQAEIMDGFAETFIGRELDVLVMGREPDGTPWGRSEYDSPDIDSRVIFSGDAAPGDMVRVRIDSVDDGELIGEQI